MLNTAMSGEELQELLGQTIQEMMERVAGIRIHPGKPSSEKDVCTVYAAFERGFHSGVSLCADLSVFVRLTRHIMQEEKVSSEDVEDFTKEFFNVVCGKIAAKLYRITRVASRFGPPVFCHGRYEPENQREDFVIHYSSDHNEGVQLIHHVTSIQEQIDEWGIL